MNFMEKTEETLEKIVAALFCLVLFTLGFACGCLGIRATHDGEKTMTYVVSNGCKHQ